MISWLQNNLLFIALSVAVISTSASIYFSDAVGFFPCTLCWYQRIFMFPLVVVLFVGIVLKDRLVWVYALPLSIMGFLFALYHNFLYYEIIPESFLECSGVSCTAEYLNLFGFVDIPLLSLVSFTLITSCLFYYRRLQAKNR